MRSLAFALLVATAYSQNSASSSSAASASTSIYSASASGSSSSSLSASVSVTLAPGHGTTIAQPAQTIIEESGTTKLERPAQTIIEGASTTKLEEPGRTVIEAGGSQSVIGGASVGASGSTIDVHNGVTVINGVTQSPNIAMATAVPAILGGVGVGIAALGGFI